MKKIFVVMINYKNEKSTTQCLEAFTTLSKRNFDLSIVIVDNFPSKRIQIDESKYKDVGLKVINNKVNGGFSGGMNLGIKYALEKKADYVLIQNTDVLVNKDFLEKLFNFMESNKDAGIVSPKIYFAKGYEFHKDRYKTEELGTVVWYAGGIMDWKNVIGQHKGVDEVDKGQFNDASETDFATGCSMLIRQSLFDKIGLLDENYFLYYEDNDFSQRAKKAGYKIYVVPQSIIWHENAGSTGGSGSPLQDYFITRNRLYFGMKYASVKSRAALIREAVKLALTGRENQKIGVKDFFLKRMGRGSMNL